MLGLFGTYASTYTDLAVSFVVLSAIFGISARYYIGKKKPFTHMLLNITGVIFLYIFLTFYLINYLINGVKTFGGTGIAKDFYYVFLIIHIIGAGTLGLSCTYLVLRSIKRFDNSQENEWKKFPFEKEYRSFHKRLGTINVWLWIFTAGSGVMVYLMLYVFAKPIPIASAF